MQQKFNELQQQTKELWAKYEKELHKNTEEEIPKEEMIHIPENSRNELEETIEEEVFINHLAQKRNVRYHPF